MFRRLLGSPLGNNSMDNFILGSWPRICFTVFLEYLSDAIETKWRIDLGRTFQSVSELLDLQSGSESSLSQEYHEW